MDDSHDEGYGLGPVEIRVAGNATSLSVLRTAVGAHAAAAGFDVDTVADLKLAVNEACTALIVSLDPPGTPLTVRVAVLADELSVEIAIEGAVADDPLAGFTGHVLNSLADDVKAYQIAADAGPAVSGVSMVVRRSNLG